MEATSRREGGKQEVRREVCRRERVREARGKGRRKARGKGGREARGAGPGVRSNGVRSPRLWDTGHYTRHSHTHYFNRPSQIEHIICKCRNICENIKF